MPGLLVEGGRKLDGAVHITGFKHSLVTVVAAACAGQAPVVIGNCPRLVESAVLVHIINALGGMAHLEGDTLTVDATRLSGTVLDGSLDSSLADRIHGSVYLAPALLGRFGEAFVPTGGGCRIGGGDAGRRPVEQYVSVLERFGAQVALESQEWLAVRARRLTGCELDLLDYTSDRARRSGPLYSGASKMAVLTAAVAHGTSVLHNLYPKPDVADLVTVLRELGAEIEHTATGSLRVHGRGPEALSRPVRHALIPDLIEIVTWVCAGAVLGAGPLRINGTGLDRAAAALRPELAVLDRMGVEVDVAADRVTVQPSGVVRRTDTVIASPGVYSDSQPFLALLATHADGASTITETVWSGRFGYAGALRSLGVDLQVRGATLAVRGPCPPRTPEQVVHGSDLRAAAVLLLAALEIDGRTMITGAEHLARGYPDLPGSLRALGAHVHEIERSEAYA